MPIVKVPREHKFGIVSLAKAEQLLSLVPPRTSATRLYKSSSPSKISQRFISKYNASCGSERDKLDVQVTQTLAHAKFKAGLHSPPPRSPLPSPTPPPLLAGPSHNVSGAWLELTLLCQCSGKHQQDVLLTLATSLNHAPLSNNHIASLLYIAGLCCQWLKSDSVSTGVLRPGELLLLRILYLVSLRLYFHHLTGSLLDIHTRDEIRQLKFDLDGFENKEKSYQDLPEALLHWKVALEVCMLVCSTCNPQPLHERALLTATNFTSGDTPNTEQRAPSTATTKLPSPHSPTPRGLSPVLWHALDVWQCSGLPDSTSLHEAIHDLLACSTDFEHENWLEAMLAMEVLCTASQRSMDALQLVQSLAAGCSGRPHSEGRQQQRSGSQQHSVQGEAHSLLSSKGDGSGRPRDDLLKKGTRFKLPASELGSPKALNRKVEPSSGGRKAAVQSLNILGMQPDFLQHESAATIEQTVVSEVPALAEHREAKEELNIPSRLTDSVGTHSLLDNETIPDILPSVISSNTSFGLIATCTTLGELPTMSMYQLEASLSSDFQANEESPCDQRPASVFRSTPVNDTAEKERVTKGRKGINRVGLLDDHFRYQDPQEDAEAPKEKEAVVREEVDTRCTNYTHSTAPLSEGAGVLGSEVPPSTVFRNSVFSAPGSTSTGAAMALAESSKFESWPCEVALAYTLHMASVVIYGKTSHIQQTALEGEHGLVQLAGFTSAASDPRSSNKELSRWSVCHAAVLGLGRVCRTCQQQPGKDGLSAVAWARMVELHCSEEDTRVLDAYRLAQACPDLDAVMLQCMESQTLSSPLLAGMAEGLATLYLPPVVHATALAPRTPAKKSAPVKVVSPKDKDRIKALKDIEPRVLTRRSPNHSSTAPPPLPPPPPTFNKRNMAALNSIAEEHWRRQMQQEAEEELKERLKAEETVRKEHDELMKRKTEKLAKRRPLVKEV